MTLPLTPVDSLTVTVLVDNSIEWFYPWPLQEFQPELRVQMQRHPPIDEKTGVPVLDLENYCCGAHGLSLLVTTSVGDEEHTILFDAGPESKSIARNVVALKADLSSVERIVLSHWHADHSGGILTALNMIADQKQACRPASTSTVVDLHPDRPEARGIWPPNMQEKPLCRLPPDPTFEAITAAQGQIELHAEAHTIAGGTVLVSGYIERTTTFEKGIVGGCQWIDGEWDVSPRNPGALVPDERYIVVDVKDRGIIVFSSCSHAGIVNVCKSALAAFNHTRPIYAVIGGFHLGGSGMEDRIPNSVDYFAHEIESPLRWVVPMHCTGFNAKVALKNALGDAVVPAGAGSQITFKCDK